MKVVLALWVLGVGGSLAHAGEVDTGIDEAHRQGYARAAACAVARDVDCAQHGCAALEDPPAWLPGFCAATLAANTAGDDARAAALLDSAFTRFRERQSIDIAAQYASFISLTAPQRRALLQTVMLTAAVFDEPPAVAAALHANWAAQASVVLARAEAGDTAAMAEACMRVNAGVGVAADPVAAIVWCTRAAERGDVEAQSQLGGMLLRGEGVDKPRDEDAVRWLASAAGRGDASAQSLLGALYGNGRAVDEDQEQAFAWLLKAATQGDPGAQFSVAYRYDHGKGVVEDDAQAVAWYLRAAEHGHGPAQNNLAVMYGAGEGVARDDVEALRWFRRAAAQDIANAQSSLGRRLMRGLGAAKDESEALTWLRKAADQGDDDAQYELGGAYYNGRGVTVDHAQAAHWYALGAEQGHGESENALGALYAHGHGVEKDPVKALALFRRAAADRIPDAQFNIGAMYADGLGVEQDLAEAMRWFERAAKQGDPDAELRMAQIHARGEGVPQDLSKAIPWLERAAEHGDAQAQFALGTLQGRGEGIAKNPQQAIEWLRKSAEQGHAEAQVALGTAYFDGDGVEKDEGVAARWILKAAEQGDATGQALFAYMLQDGMGVDADPAQAVTWLRKAADQGDAGAQASLASALELGVGTPKDEHAAAEWYAKAAAQGSAEAQQRLANLHFDGRGVARDHARAVALWEAAAAQGLALAQTRLAYAHEMGFGTAPDPDKARALYARAAKQGDEYSRDRLVAYACLETRTCTTVDGIHPAFATRNYVRANLKRGGARPRREDDRYRVDIYQGATTSSYRKLTAQYFEQRLANLALEFRGTDGIAAKLAELEAAFGKPDSAEGAFADEENSRRTWRRDDGVDVALVRWAGDDAFTVEYEVPAVVAARESSDAAGAADDGDGDGDGDDSPTARSATDSESTQSPPATQPAEPEGARISTMQATLVFTAESPVLLERETLTVEACGTGDDFEHLDAHAGNEVAYYIEPASGGTVSVKLGLPDGFADPVYTFAEVRPGARVFSDSDGPAPRITLVYTPTQSPACLHVHFRDRSPREIAKQIASTAGVTIRGLERIPEVPPVTANFDASVDVLMSLVADMAEVAIARVDATRYEVRTARP